MSCFDPYNPELFENCCCCCDDPHVSPEPPIPTDGLMLWVNDESIVQAGGVLTSWDDLSGFDNNLTPNAATWPISSQNGLACLGSVASFNFVNKAVLNSSGPINKRAYVGAAKFSVGAATGTTRLGGLMTAQGLDVMLYAQLSSGTYKLIIQCGASVTTCNLPGIAVGDPLVWAVWNNGLGNNNWDFRVWHGANKVTFNATNGNSPNPQTQYYGLARPDGASLRYWNQPVFELAMYERQFDDASAETWYEYLNEKWALGITAPV